MEKYAIRSGSKRLPSIGQQWTAIYEASFDTFVVKPLLLYITFHYVAKPFIVFDEAPPVLYIICWHVLCLQVVFATSLFWIHMGLHKITFLYKYVHKKHHAFHESVGFAAQYHHPIEALLSTSHIVLGIILVRPHIISYLVFLAATLIEIVDAHCGYDVPWNILYLWSDNYPWGSGARAHDYHHSHNIGIYGGGLLGLWDELFGTNSDFKEFEKKRKLELQLNSLKSTQQHIQNKLNKSK